MFQFTEEFKRFARKITGDHGPEIRHMQQRDLDEVLRLIRLHDSDDYKAAKQSFKHTRFDEPIDVMANFVLIDPEEQRPVAVAGYYIEDLEARGVYWLGWTYVNPFFRGRGYGGALMEFVLQALQSIGARKCFLTTSNLPKYETAVGFYKRYGFVVEGQLRDFYNPGEDQLIMGVNLAMVPQFKNRNWPKITPKPSTRPIDEQPRRPEDDDDKVVFEF